MQSDPDKQQTDYTAIFRRFFRPLALLWQEFLEYVRRRPEGIRRSPGKRSALKVLFDGASSLVQALFQLGKRTGTVAARAGTRLGKVLGRMGRELVAVLGRTGRRLVAVLGRTGRRRGTVPGRTGRSEGAAAGRASGSRQGTPRRMQGLPGGAALAGAAALVLGICLFLVSPAGRAVRPGADTDGNANVGGEVLSFQSGTRRGAQALPLGTAFQGMLDGAGEAFLSTRDQARESLENRYRAILDEGKGASYVPDSASGQKLWQKVRKERREELQEDPFLLLVNQWHYLPEGYEAEPVDLPNGQRIDADCYEALTQMLADCAAQGGTPIVCSGYRPHWYQENLFDAQVARWLNAGCGQEDARALAATAVAIPGTSEHELGLAADIYSTENMDLDESQIYTFTQQWLMANSWRYGFVLRYPQDKSEITGIIFEPWHYRYVGKEHAKKIYEAGICLEEYLDLAEHP